MPAEENVQPSHLKGRIEFTSMYNDVNSGQNGNAEKCKENATHVASLAKDFEPGRWSFLGPGDEKNVVRELDPQTRRKRELYSEDYDARIR